MYSLEQDYKLSSKNKIIKIALFSILTLFMFILDISTGPLPIDFYDVIKLMLGMDLSNPKYAMIITDVRLPSALMAILVGIFLSLSGAQMQTILNNPMADPFILGISSGASLGAGLAIVLGFSAFGVAGQYMIVGNAFLFAIGASCIVYLISKMRSVTSETMILAGIAIMFGCSAILSILQLLATERALKMLTFWNMGSLTGANWFVIKLFIISLIIVLPFFIKNVWTLTILRLGDENAKSLGVSVESLRIRVLFIVSLLSAVAVSFVGTIGFIGLVAPHIARLMVGEEQRFFIPLTAVMGAFILMCTSYLSKIIIPGMILPIGVITSVVGLPFFMFMILKNKKNVF